MKLVVLYGPPGVGKLTVARALAQKTGYKVFHNHLMIELLCSLFAWGSKPYNALVKKYRLELLETAVKYKVRGVILTLVYPAEAGEKEMRELKRRMKQHRVSVCFVQLDCTQKALEKRIKGPSRKAFTKIRHITSLRSFMKKHDVNTTIPIGENLVIDTTELSPANTARRIARQFTL